MALPPIPKELFDGKIIAMYARGMAMREIHAFLREQYGREVGPEFISAVTDAVMAEVGARQFRPREALYPVFFFDAPRVKIGEDAVVCNKAIDLALECCPTARARTWESGSRTPRVRSSGSRSSAA